MRRSLKLILICLVFANPLHQWPEVHAETSGSEPLFGDKPDSTQGYTLESNFVFKLGDAVYTGSQLTELVVDGTRKLVTITYSFSNEHLNNYKVGLAKIQQHWDLKRGVVNHIDLSYQSCRSSPITAASHTFSHSYNSSRCPFILILGHYLRSDDISGKLVMSQFVLPIYNYNILRWLTQAAYDEQQGDQNKTYDSHEIGGIDNFCLDQIDLSTGNSEICNFAHGDGRFTVKGRFSSINFKDTFQGKPMELDIVIERLNVLDLAKSRDVNDIKLYSNSRLCHETLGALRIDYPTLSDGKETFEVPDESREELIENLIKLYSLDARRITMFDIDTSRQIETGYISVHIELLEKLSKFESVKEPIELPVQKGLYISERNMRRMLNISTIRVPATNKEDCLEFCRIHDCNTAVHCQQLSECHIYLYPVSLPGSLSQPQSSSLEPICRTIEMRPKYKPLSGWALQEIKSHLQRHQDSTNQATLKLDIKLANGRQLVPSRFTFDIINNPSNDEIIDIPEDRYRLISAKHKLDIRKSDLILLDAKKVARVQDCLHLCNKLDSCVSLSYCQTTDNTCLLSSENLISFTHTNDGAPEANLSSLIADDDCLVASKRLTRQFHEVITLNKQSQGDFGPGELLSNKIDYCATACFTKSDQRCNSFGICKKIQDEKVNLDCKLGFNSNRSDSNTSCKLFERDLLLQFDSILGHMLPDEVKSYRSSITTAEQCAKSCVEQDNCGAFEFCITRGAGYMEFHPWCSIGLEQTITSEPRLIHNGNPFCSIYKLKNLNKNWTSAQIKKNNDDKIDDQTESKQNRPRADDSWSSGSIVLLLIVGFGFTSSLTYFVRKHMRQRNNRTQSAPKGMSLDDSSPQETDNGTSIELRDVKVDVNPKVVITGEDSPSIDESTPKSPTS